MNVIKGRNFTRGARVFVRGGGTRILAPRLCRFREASTFVRDQKQVDGPMVGLPMKVMRRIVVPNVRARIFKTYYRLIQRLCFIRMLAFGQSFPCQIIFEDDRVSVLIVIRQMGRTLTIVTAAMANFRTMSFRLSFQAKVVKVVRKRFLLLFHVRVSYSKGEIVLGRTV